MPNEIVFNEESGIYRVRSSGLITIEEILESIEELNKKGVADTLIYVLIDTLRQTSELSILDVEKVLKAMPGRKRFRSAILTSSDHINISEQQLLSKTAGCQGKAIRLFTDKEEALEWLLQEK